jgi:hypothetical protein
MNHQKRVRDQPMRVRYTRYSIQAAAVAVSVCLAAGKVGAEVPQQVRFNRDIRPIMSDTCFKCHGPGTRKAGLRLDLPDEALKPAESGATPIVPGNPDQSEAVRRVFAADESEGNVQAVGGTRRRLRKALVV